MKAEDECRSPRVRRPHPARAGDAVDDRSVQHRHAVPGVPADRRRVRRRHRAAPADRDGVHARVRRDEHLPRTAVRLPRPRARSSWGRSWCSSVASLACTIAPTFELLLAGRVVQGLSAGGATIVSRTVIRDMFEGEQAQRLMSRVALIFGVAPAIAPIVGGGAAPDRPVGARSSRSRCCSASYSSSATLIVLPETPSRVGASAAAGRRGRARPDRGRARSPPSTAWPGPARSASARSSSTSVAPRSSWSTCSGRASSTSGSCSSR